jgi:hypothetical protein
VIGEDVPRTEVTEDGVECGFGALISQRFDRLEYAFRYDSTFVSLVLG